MLLRRSKTQNIANYNNPGVHFEQGRVRFNSWGNLANNEQFCDRKGFTVLLPLEKKASGLGLACLIKFVTPGGSARKLLAFSESKVEIHGKQAETFDTDIWRGEGGDSAVATAKHVMKDQIAFNFCQM